MGEDIISDDQVVDAFLRAARQAQAERPRIGVTNAHEWATTGRVGMRLCRLPEIIALEKERIFLDIEYGQMSAGEMKYSGLAMSEDQRHLPWSDFWGDLGAGAYIR